MQLHYSSHHPPISSSDLTLSFICRTTCTICLRVAARFMQCGKDYPPCLHALFYLHTHDVLTNLVNCIFCRRPQKWWAARKELVASEQVKKKSRLLDSKSGFHKSTTYTSKPPFSLYMGTKVHAVWHSQPNAADTIFWYCRNSIGWWLVIGVFFGASKSRWAWPGMIRCQCIYDSWLRGPIKKGFKRIIIVFLRYDQRT